MVPGLQNAPSGLGDSSHVLVERLHEVSMHADGDPQSMSPSHEPGLGQPRGVTTYLDTLAPPARSQKGSEVSVSASGKLVVTQLALSHSSPWVWRKNATRLPLVVESGISFKHALPPGVSTSNICTGGEVGEEPRVRCV